MGGMEQIAVKAAMVEIDSRAGCRVAFIVVSIVG